MTAMPRDYICNLLFHAHYMTGRLSMWHGELFFLSQAFYGELLFVTKNLKKYHSLWQNGVKCR